MTDLQAGYEALHSGAAVVEIGRDIVAVSGPDAVRYLQGQLSQDLERLQPGASAWSLLLQPQGKLVALLRCTRLGTGQWLLDTDAGTGPAVVERLLRFRLRTKADVEQLDWRCLAVRGPAASEAPPFDEGPPGAGAPPVNGSATVAARFDWQGLEGYDLLGPSPLPPAGAVPVTPEVYEVARVEAGFPKHPTELDERTIPAEAGIVEAAVSFTKGCYTGQELVARIDSRGSKVPRHLRGFRLSGPATAGADLWAVDGSDEAQRSTARLSSVVFSPAFGWVALGYASRAVQVGDVLQAKGASGDPVTALVELLPMAGR